MAESVQPLALSKPMVQAAAPKVSAKPKGRAAQPQPGSEPTANAAAPDTRGLIAAVRLWEESQRYRIRVGNLIGAIERGGAAVPIELGKYLEHLTTGEKGLAKLITREWKHHPLAPWAKTVRGLGEHSAAVLVAMLDGNPYIAYPKHWEGPGRARIEAKTISVSPARTITPAQTSRSPSGRDTRHAQSKVEAPARVLVAGEPFTRTPGQLWQYCGIGAPGKRKAGMSQEEALALGKPLLKSRMRLIAESFIKAKNEYRAVYDLERVRVENHTHTAPCPQCHAKAGDPWKDGHKHASALRLVAKRFLLDLWLESKRLHESGEW